MRFLTGWLRMLAAFMRSAAALLERISSPQPASAAMVDLTARYPGAPDHWLQYIAAHTPHLSEIEDQQPQSISRREDPQDVDQPAQQPKKARLSFVSNGKARKPPSLKFLGGELQQPAAKISFAKNRDAKSLSRPHFVPADTGRVKTAPLRLQPDVANDVRPPIANDAYAPAEIANAEIAALASPVRKSNLRLIRDEEAPARQAAAEERTSELAEKMAGEFRWTSASPISRFMQMIGLEEQSAPNATSSGAIAPRHAAPAKRLAEFDKISTVRSAQDVSLPDLFAAVPGHARSLAFSRQISRIPDMPHPLTDSAKPAPASGNFSVEHFDVRWPALPPIVETIHDAPIEPPRLSRLVREQEEGLWNA